MFFVGTSLALRAERVNWLSPRTLQLHAVKLGGALDAITFLIVPEPPHNLTACARGAMIALRRKSRNSSTAPASLAVIESMDQWPALIPGHK